MDDPVYRNLALFAERESQSFSNGIAKTSGDIRTQIIGIISPLVVTEPNPPRAIVLTGKGWQRRKPT